MHAAKLEMTMVETSVMDERAFSALSFIKNRLRARLTRRHSYEELASVHAGEVAAPFQRGFVPVQLCVLGVKVGLLLIATVACARLNDVAAEGGEKLLGGMRRK
jgi:hypothetical protein